MAAGPCEDSCHALLVAPSSSGLQRERQAQVLPVILQSSSVSRFQREDIVDLSRFPGWLLSLTSTRLVSSSNVPPTLPTLSPFRHAQLHKSGQRATSDQTKRKEEKKLKRWWIFKTKEKGRFLGCDLNLLFWNVPHCLLPWWNYRLQDAPLTQHFCL